MRFRTVFALVIVSCTSSLLAQPKGKGKNPKEFEAGKPAFAPNHDQPAFDPAAAKGEHLDPAMFRVPEGLEVTLWAASPMLFNPANMDIDHAGRIWVNEGVNYRRAAGRHRNGDRIMVLEDTDKDGKADKSHVFVQEPALGCPLGIAVFDNVIVVSNTPDLIVYTDVNRDLKFDPSVDTREVLLSGFEQPQHDHSLHAVIGGPDGRWYFSNGNCGAQFTDKSGHTFSIGGAYLNNSYAGEKSYDGRVYVGGFTASIDPDGKNTRIYGHGYRNSYEQTITSFGDMFQNDNDDPPACRVSHVIEGGFFGFFSPDGKRQWKADQRPGQTTARAEWRQDDPSTIPAGDVYGGGAPTGMTFVENSALGEKWEGLLLSCETGRNVVFGYLPKANGAGFTLERFDFLTTNTTGKFAGSDFVGGSNNVSDERHILFRPSDVCVGPDGAIYICDWYDKRTGGHQTLDDTASGAIYRVAPKGFKPAVPAVDLNTTEGQIAALKSPAVNTRFSGFRKLKEKGDIGVVEKLMADESPWVAARATWLMAQLGEKGTEKVAELIESEDPQKKVLALRAIKAAGHPDLPVMAIAFAATEENAAVLREVCTVLRDAPPDEDVVNEALADVGKKFDGKDLSLLGAWGIACAGREEKVFHALELEDPLSWSDAEALLVWKIHPKAAVQAVALRAEASTLNQAQRKLAADTLAFIQDEAAAKAMIALAKDKASPIAGDVLWWLINRSSNDWAVYGVGEAMKKAGILDTSKTPIVPVITPPSPAPDQGPQLADVLKLKGDAAKGATAAQRCIMCHNINGQGVDFGPALTGWGRSQPVDVIAEAILNPSKDLAHGFEGHSVKTKKNEQVDGMILADGDFVMIKSIGGQTQLIASDQVRSKAKMNRSLMLSASQLGMTAQDVADVIAYLKQ
ncbi:MAG: c-type cytochrome [Verrucomicrobiaceae bacterium]|nr:c-type cytochrome [Verrucomicrobiaceae bacterium]